MHNVVKDLCLGCSRSRKDRGAKTSLTALLVLKLFGVILHFHRGKNKELCFTVKWIF